VQGVASSNPAAPTNQLNRLRPVFLFASLAGVPAGTPC
jgi:hypothetical protein